MKAQSVEDAGSLKAAVATIAARDYRKAISTLEKWKTGATRPAAKEGGRLGSSSAEPDLMVMMHCRKK
jgi:hypothetical protein